MSEKKTSFTINEDGFHGTLFKSINNLYPKKILIVCSGSDGDFKNAEYSAKIFEENGLNTLALGYFNIPNGPSAINKVPIEYVENAANYLKSIGYEKIGIWGISIGSLYALLSGCLLPDLISLVVAASPCYFVIQGMDSKKNILFDASSFSYKNEEIPYEPYSSKMTMLKNIYHSIKHLEPNFSYLYEPLMGKVPEEHIIPVEKMKAHIILFSGKLDHLWPSTQSGELIMNRLKEKNYAYPYEHIICDHGGHLMVPSPTKLDIFFVANRKYKQDTENYRKEHLNKLLETFKTW